MACRTFKAIVLGIPIAGVAILLAGCSHSSTPSPSPGPAPSERHYAREDGQLYTKAQFQKWYAGKYLIEWAATPEERRVAQDNKAYSMKAFQQRYGGSLWVRNWNVARMATQMHTAKDGQNYTIKEFLNYYHSTWPEQWKTTRDIPCWECCGGINHADCDMRYKFCTWRWTGDWRNSCVMKAAMEGGEPTSSVSTNTSANTSAQVGLIV